MRKGLVLLVALCLVAIPIISSGMQASAALYQQGDVNGDGRINTSDYVLVKRHVLRTLELDAARRERADVTGDGRINISDYALLKRHVLGTYDLNGGINYKDHLFLQTKGMGNCETLTGKICLMLVFVSDTESTWDSASRADAEQKLCQEMIKLMNYAEGFGADLDIYYGEWDLYLPTDVESYTAYDWQSTFASQVGYSSFHDVQTSLEKEWQVASAPLVFVLNKEGRACAYTYSSPVGEEFMTVYSSDYSTFCHEMLHLYGAEDFYYPKTVTDAAKTYLPGSIMLDGSTVDDVTAYIVGWKKTLSENAKKFLKATAHLTAEDMAEADKAEQLTGYGTKYYADGSVYTGYMEFGIPHGEGIMEYANGDRYEGGWRNGQIYGYGTYYEKNGKRTSGYWINGVLQ